MINVFQVLMRFGLGVLVALGVWWLALEQNADYLHISFQVTGLAMIFWTFFTNISSAGTSSLEDLKAPSARQVEGQKMSWIRQGFRSVSPILNVVAGSLLFVSSYFIRFFVQ